MATRRQRRRNFRRIGIKKEIFSPTQTLVLVLTSEGEKVGRYLCDIACKMDNTINEMVAKSTAQ